MNSNGMKIDDVAIVERKVRETYVQTTQ